MSRRDTTIDRAAVRAVIEQQFPELAPAAVAYLGEGCDSTAFDVNGVWVFRFPKRPDVEEQLRLEHRFLPRLAEASPLPVPVYQYAGKASPQYPLAFGGYRKLAGVTALQAGVEQPSADLAHAVGCFLSRLHAFPIEVGRECGVPDEDTAATIEALRLEAIDGFQVVREAAPGEPVDHWLEFLERGIDTLVAVPARRCLLHNDFAAEHVLVEPRSGAATGVIDWSDVAIGDPVMDLAGILHWGGERFTAGVLAAYDGDFTAADAARAGLIGACRGVGDIGFGCRMSRPEYVAGGIRALRHCVR